VVAFNAESIVEPMEFTLRPFADVSGVIPEPTKVQVQEFLNARAREGERLRKAFADVPEDEDFETRMARLSPEMAADVLQRSAEIHSALCSGTPSAGDLVKLPHRQFDAFTEWLAKEVLDPEAWTGAGNAQVINLPSAAAG
jgi:hypothetical protein